MFGQYGRHADVFAVLEFGHLAATFGRMTNTTQIANRIEDARNRANITNLALSVATNIPDRTLRRRMANPEGFSLAELISIARALDVNLEALVAESTETVQAAA